MRILVLGAAGFIGTNLTIKLAEVKSNIITLVDKDKSFFNSTIDMKFQNVKFEEATFDEQTNFDKLFSDQDVVFHLISTTVPTTANQHIPDELVANVVVTSKMLESCVKCNVKKVVFISSGGTVYGKADNCPLEESTPTNPISSYGVQKVTIEKLLYLYHYMYGLDYRVVRLANPYGPYQRPNGILGAVTTFTYKALKGEEIVVYGDGSVVRDFIYIDDAVKAIITIATGESEHRIFNVGSGYGKSVKQVLDTIHETLGIEMKVTYEPGRKVDVPINYLDISRYERTYGKLHSIALEQGIIHLAEFMRKIYSI